MEILSPNASPKACLGQSTCTWQILSPDRLSVESGVSSFLLPLQWNNVCSKLCKTLQDSLLRRGSTNLPIRWSLLGEYSKILDEVSPDLPAQLQAKLEDVRQELPRLFRSSYPMVLQHDDLLENNIHVDEATGHITGIIDWADAKIAPFGVSLANMEVVLGIQTRTNWHFHPNHHSLRELFWKTFYRVTGHISKDDRRSIEVARLFGFFREHGREEKEHAIAYLSSLCLL